MDGEAVVQYFTILRDVGRKNNSVLDLPNTTIDTCCIKNKIKVLATTSTTNANQNDVTSVIQAIPETATFPQFKLYKYENGSWVEKAILDDNTYGTFFDLGFHTSGEVSYIGYLISWHEVLGDFDEGTYKIGFTYSDSFLGNYSAYTNEYQLCKYFDWRADGTIRIEWYQTGTLADLDDDTKTFSYPANWKNQIRLEGFFGYPTSDYVKEFVRYQNGLEEWVKDEQDPIYMLKTKPFPAYIHRLFMLNIMQADRVKISDYNANNAEQWIDKEIRFDSEYKPTWAPLVNKLAPIQLTCKQRYNNTKKHRI